MSDFLDRLATRALGGEGLLMPRLPSLFEPVAGAPVAMDMAETAHVASRQVIASPAIEAPIERRDPPASPAAVEKIAARMPPVAPASEKLSARAAEEPSVRPPATTAQRSPGIARGDPEPGLRDHGVDAPRLATVERREVRTINGNLSIPAPPTPRGVLLAPASAIFARPDAGSPGTGNAGVPGVSRSRTAHANAEKKAGEPVIHVSIGRIEVRAAPTGAAPSRRHEAARPDSLDDYLRQRGKASP